MPAGCRMSDGSISSDGAGAAAAGGNNSHRAASQHAKPKPKRINPQNRLIAELQGLVLEKQHEVDALVAERRTLLVRATAAQAVVDHCSALVALAEALHDLMGDSQHRRRASAGSEGSFSSSEGTGRAAAARATAAASLEVQQWQQHLDQTKQQLRDGATSSRATFPSTVQDNIGSRPSSANTAEHPTLEMHWWPSEELLTLNPKHSYSVDGFRSLLKESIRHFGCLLP